MQTGTPVQLNTVLGGGEDHQYAALWIQPRGTNAGIIYIGADNTVSTTSYGVRLEIPVTGIPQAPFNPGEFSVGGAGWGARSPNKLSNYWALGTTGDFLHILATWY